MAPDVTKLPPHSSGGLDRRAAWIQWWYLAASGRYYVNGGHICARQIACRRNTLARLRWADHSSICEMNHYENAFFKSR